MDRKRTWIARSVTGTRLVAVAAALTLYAQSPMADDREAFLRAAAQRDVTAFEALDRNRTGRLSLIEVRGNVDLEARFNDLDINRDGFITRAELTRYVAFQYGVVVAQ